MTTTTRISTAERIGRAFGRGWRAYARGERRTSSWLVSKGVPVAGTTVLLWAVKLAVLGLLLYVAFWLPPAPPRCRYGRSTTPASGSTPGSRS